MTLRQGCSDAHDVVSAAERELFLVHERRVGVEAAFTSRGTLASATSTAFSPEPLALALCLPEPPHPERN